MAETLREFRETPQLQPEGRERPRAVRRVPVIATWDDHETTNNWWPGEVLEDDRWRRRCGHPGSPRPTPGRVPAHRRRPLAEAGTGPSRADLPEDLRGPALDVFVLDMRTHKGENTDGRE